MHYIFLRKQLNLSVVESSFKSWEEHTAVNLYGVQSYPCDVISHVSTAQQWYSLHGLDNFFDDLIFTRFLGVVYFDSHVWCFLVASYCSCMPFVSMTCLCYFLPPRLFWLVWRVSLRKDLLTFWLRFLRAIFLSYLTASLVLRREPRNHWLVVATPWLIIWN